MIAAPAISRTNNKVTITLADGSTISAPMIASTMIKLGSDYGTATPPYAPGTLYWGVSAKQQLTASDILGLGNSAPVESGQRSITYNCMGGRYPYLAYPSDINEPLATINGFMFSDLIATSITTASPLTVLRFGNLQNGSAIPVEWFFEA